MSNILGLNGAPLAINGAPITCASAGTDTSDATISSNSQLLYPYTSYGNGIKYTGSIPSLGATTYYPSTSDQTIAAAQYLSGLQTIKGLVISDNLVASNLKNGVTVTIGDSNDDDRILSITGTYTGGYQYAMTSAEFSSESKSITFSDLLGTPAFCFIFANVYSTYTYRIQMAGGVTNNNNATGVYCTFKDSSGYLRYDPLLITKTNNSLTLTIDSNYATYYSNLYFYDNDYYLQYFYS